MVKTSELEIPKFHFALREDLQNDSRFLPTKANETDTGFDVKAAQPNGKDIILRAGKYCKIPLGFRAFCPDGWWYHIHPRSSSFTKRNMHSHIGIVDNSFFLEALFCFQYLPDITSLGTDLVIKFGDTIAQIVPYRLQNMDVVPVSNEELDKMFGERKSTRTGGFGSTGI